MMFCTQLPSGDSGAVAIAALNHHVLVKTITKERRVTLAVQSGNWNELFIFLLISIPDPDVEQDQYQ